MARLALFDLDRTLVRKDTAGLFMRYELSQGLTTHWRVAKVALWRALYTLGQVDAPRAAAELLSWNRGRSEEELRRHTQRCFETMIRPQISEIGRATVARHHAAGDRVAIVTASTRYSAEGVAAELGVTDLICTEVDVSSSGQLTGELAGPLCYGESKLAKVLSYAKRQDSSLADATFYSDSITDLPTLMAVGYPVVVNPDPRLAATAAKRGWPTERW